MEIEKCKGSRDLLPGDMVRFRRIEDVFRKACLDWGYGEVRTPTLEYLHLFTSVGTLTPSMLSRTYSFLDWDGWSGERIVLRPEATIAAARLYIENLSDLSPAKLFYIENVFRFDESGTRSRERWQCGAEVLGSAKTLADIEMIMLSMDVLRKLGIIDVELHLSHAGLIRALLTALGLSAHEQVRVFDQILDEDHSVIEKLIGDNPQFTEALDLFFRAKGKSAGFLQNLQALLSKSFPVPGIEDSIAEFTHLAERLSEFDCKYVIDIASGRGFEYYTGIIFRLHCGDQKVGGGGRYNDLIPLLGGGNVPASGFGLQMDKIMEMTDIPPDERYRVLVQCRTDSAKAERLCFETAADLRRRGYIADIDHDGTGTACKWTISVEGDVDHPVYRLMDQAANVVVEAGSCSAICEQLQEAKANEASIT